jgi:hypothetical protein
MSLSDKEEREERIIKDKTKMEEKENNKTYKNNDVNEEEEENASFWFLGCETVTAGLPYL